MIARIQKLPVVLDASMPPPSPLPPSPTVDLPSFETMDRVGRSMIARFTGGVSPHAQSAAWFDWLSHFSRAYGRQLELAALGGVLGVRLAISMAGSTVPPLQTQATDHRFTHPAWQTFPFFSWQQMFLAQEEWWRSATRPSRHEGQERRSRCS